MRYAALVALLALAGCQTNSNSYASLGDNTGHLTHQFINVTREATDNYPWTDRFGFIEVFHETRGIGVRLTSRRLCWETVNDCFREEYDIDIPPNATVRVPSGMFTREPDIETFRETYEGTDYQGNPVVLTTVFRPSDYMK